MSLKAFHIFFVTVSVALAFSFGYWNLSVFPGNSVHLTAAICSFGFGVVLTVYGIRFYKKIVQKAGKFFWAIPLFFLGSGQAWACSVCFGDPNSLQAQGMRSAIFFLLGIVVLMWIFFGVFFYRLWRASKGVSIS